MVRVLQNPMARLADAAALGPASVARVAALLPRATALLDAADLVLTRIAELVTRLEDWESRVQAVTERVAASEAAARLVIEDVAETQRRASALLDVYEPILGRSAPTATHASERIGPAQVDALVAYLDFLPMLQAIDQEVVPAMSTLQTVGPDLTELVAVSRGLNELMGSLPGLGRAKKRVDEEIDRESSDGQ